MYVELLVGNESGTKVYQPVVQEGIEWSTERKNTPGKLVFKVLYDNILDFSEGSPVRMKVDGDNVFFGFVFKQQRSKDKIITVTAYDQLRYLKNKDTKVYENKTASQFVKMIADDYVLNLGTLDDTGYVIESRIEENSELFEMITNALDLTLTNTGEMYVLYKAYNSMRNNVNTAFDWYCGDNLDLKEYIGYESGNFAHAGNVTHAIKCFDIEKNDSYKNFSKVMDKANDILKESDKTSLTDDDKALINSMLPDYDKYPSVAKLQAVEIAKSSSKMATLLMLDERYNETVSEALES